MQNSTGSFPPLARLHQPKQDRLVLERHAHPTGRARSAGDPLRQFGLPKLQSGIEDDGLL